EYAQDDEENVRHPDQKLGMHFWISAEGVGNDDEKKISDRDDQSHGEADRGFAAVRGHAERDTDDGERDARERKRESFVDLGPALAALPRAFALQLIEQLFDRHGGSARPFLLFLVKLVEADRQRPFMHANAVLDFAEIGWVVLIALLITRVVEMHEDAFVIEIGLEHTGARERHPHRHRFLIELEHGDVLKFVAFFFADVNFSPGKLIDHLVAAKKRHRITRGEIENGTAQFFLRGRRYLDGEPETKRRAHERNNAERNSDARDAHTVGAERDQFVIGRKPAEDEEDCGEQSPRDGEDERERKDVS